MYECHSNTISIIKTDDYPKIFLNFMIFIYNLKARHIYTIYIYIFFCYKLHDTAVRPDIFIAFLF